MCVCAIMCKLGSLQQSWFGIYKEKKYIWFISYAFDPVQSSDCCFAACKWFDCSAILRKCDPSTPQRINIFPVQTIRRSLLWSVYPSTFSFYLFFGTHHGHQSNDFYIELHLHMWLPQIAMTQWSRTKHKSIFHLAQACLMGIFYQSQTYIFLWIYY